MDNREELEEFTEEDIFINSILKSKLRSIVMIGHIDKCLKLLEDEECRKNTHEKYLAFKYFYLDGMTYENIAEIYGYGERTARRWITELTGYLVYISLVQTPLCWIRALTGACQNRVLAMSVWTIYNCNMQNWMKRKADWFCTLPI